MGTGLHFLKSPIVLVRFNHVANSIVNANDEKRSIVRGDEKLAEFLELVPGVRLALNA